MKSCSNFGRYIVVEGLEGSGKTTMIGFVKKMLIKEGFDILTVREPGGTPISEKIRKLIKKNFPEEKFLVKTELFMFYAARIQLMENIILPNLKSGKWVIGDRNFLSSYAYQGGKYGVKDDEIDKINKIAIGKFQPDLIIYLDVFPEIGISRIHERKSSKLDRIEKRSLDFFHQVRNRYLNIIKNQKEFMIIDANQDLSSVKRLFQHKICRWMKRLYQ
ncbi:dTMP kinase [Candidatus Riesia pediculicola]|uniref:Thymidylate kinase n=1 Tax=Riesia pediculicola (strain USDA) TaxID=515618 RepID=D4G8I7_RIEPU|nr:dTMP kinase [Candidatus Riesia pediculicola]ADD79860.1 thymidylate kinase [Candidatus Riesia pediculicola USDA]ARC53866.1 hypothetical protein AOE55_01755 [Candidatus Riesia pediculicola]QOJ86497.1 dTMP kinase [Candidatus Riesia pediculicola]